MSQLQLRSSLVVIIITNHHDIMAPPSNWLALMLKSLNIGLTSSTTLNNLGILQGLLSITSNPASLNFINSLLSKSSTCAAVKAQMG